MTPTSEPRSSERLTPSRMGSAIRGEQPPRKPRTRMQPSREKSTLLIACSASLLPANAAEAPSESDSAATITSRMAAEPSVAMRTAAKGVGAARSVGPELEGTRVDGGAGGAGGGAALGAGSGAVRQAGSEPGAKEQGDTRIRSLMVRPALVSGARLSMRQAWSTFLSFGDGRPLAAKAWRSGTASAQRHDSEQPEPGWLRQAAWSGAVAGKYGVN